MTDWENKRLNLEYGPTVGRDGHVRRAERDDGLKVFGRCFSNAQMQEFDRRVAGIDASLAEALRQLVREMA